MRDPAKGSDAVLRALPREKSRLGIPSGGSIAMRFSWVLLPAGIASLAFGLYSVGAAIPAELAYASNSVACTTAPDCGTGPPPVNALIVVSVLFLVAGFLVLVWGVVRLRHERRERSVPTRI
jgi:hypothetical protein